MSSEVESNSEELSFMIILPKIQEIVWDKDALLEDTYHDESLDSNQSSYLKMSCTTTSNNSFTNLLEKFDLRAPEEVVEKVHTKMFGDVLPIMDEDMFFLHGSSSEVIISCSTCCLVGLIRATWICASFNSIQVIISCSTCTDPCCPNRSKKAASTAADDDLYRVQTCTDPCCPNRSKEAASTATGDGLYLVVKAIHQERKIIILDRIVLMNFFEITCMERICRN